MDVAVRNLTRGYPRGELVPGVVHEDEPRETSGGDPHQLPRDGRAQGAAVVVVIVTASSRATRTITLIFVSNEVCASTEMCTRRARGRCVCVH